MFPKEIWYFEASAIHFLRQSRTAFDARATRDLQRELGRWIAISPVTLWEILNTRDKDTREELLFFAQNFFEREILMTPEEAIIGFVSANCPLHERKRDIRSDIYGEQWREMVDDPRRTLSFDDYSHSKTDIMRKLSKLLYRTAREVKLDKVFDVVTDFQISSKFLLNQIKHPAVTMCSDEEQLGLYRTASLLIFLMFCSEITPDATPYRHFWKQTRISDPLQRYLYLAERHPALIFRGPFILMAMMARLQARRRFSRGLLFDCMHAVYLPYCDLMFSDDRHFVDLSNEADHFNFKKISMISEVPITTTTREILMPHLGILSEQPLS